MFSLYTLSLCLAVLHVARAFQGDATFYDTGLGACGQNHAGTELVAAVSQTEYGQQANPNTAPVCQQCATVKREGKEVKVKIVDKCMACKSGDIDLSPSAFEKIADKSAGRVKVTWDLGAC